MSETNQIPNESRRPPVAYGWDWVTPEQAAELTGYTKDTLLDFARADEIPAHPKGKGKRRRWRFRISELDRWMGQERNNSRLTLPAVASERVDGIVREVCRRKAS